MAEGRKSPEERQAQTKREKQPTVRQQADQDQWAERARRQREAGTRVALALRERWKDNVEELVAMLKEAGEHKLAELVRHPWGGSTVNGIFVPNPAPENA